MKKYLVGGAVRDKLLGKEPKDLDYVVIDETVESMISKGFQQVGKSFPVFIDPVTNSEYALARKESKTGTGHHSFNFQTDNVTLTDDLFRRDLTINAMALDDKGKLIDPFNGKEDLSNGILRHVSNHFAEDPLRVLRVARFASQLNFQVDPTTIELIKTIPARELTSLSANRVRQELLKVFNSNYPELFFKVLKETNTFDLFFKDSINNIIKSDTVELSLALSFNSNAKKTFFTNDEYKLICIKPQFYSLTNPQNMLNFILKNKLHQDLAKQHKVVAMMSSLNISSVFVLKSIESLKSLDLQNADIKTIKEKQLNSMVVF